MSNRILPTSISRDVIFGGDGLVSGTTKIDSAPDVPVSRRVRLFDGKTADLVREDWSEADGTYIFNGIERSAQRKYFVTSHDHTEAYNAVIADRIAAEPMEAQTPSGIVLDAFDSGADDGVSPDSIEYWTTYLSHMDSVTIDPLGDANYQDVSLLLKFENGFADDSPNQKAVTANSVVVSSAQKKFGSSSAFFSGSNTGIRLPTSSELTLSADWTIEAFVFMTTLGSDDMKIVTANYPAANNQFYITNGGASPKLAVYDGATAKTSVDTFARSINTWYHIAACRSGNSLYFFADGVQLGAPLTLTGALDFSAGGIGAFYSSGSPSSGRLVGYMDELRITKGFARYTAGFTPPAATFGMAIKQLDYVKGAPTYLLGDTDASAAQYKYGTKSLAFDGVGDFGRLVVAAAIGTQNFTAEAWVRITTIASGFAVLETRGAAADATGFFFGVNTGGKLIVTTNNITTAGTTTLSADTWHHVALVRSFGTLRGYLNGTQEFSVANSANLSLTNWRIGHNFNASGTYSAGYIDELRVTNGVGRYVATFTPPDAAFPDS